MIFPLAVRDGCKGMITADYYIKSGDAQRKVMVIGAETLSRVSDPHDIDCMIYSDGAGATVLEASENGGGVLSHVTRSDTYDNAYLMTLGKSYGPGCNGDELFIKMDGHDIYKYAVRTVPKVVKAEPRQGRINVERCEKGPDPPGQSKDG